MIRKLAVLALLAVVVVPIAIAPHWWGDVAVVEVGPVGDRLIARGVVVPVDGIARVGGPPHGRVTKVLVRAGDRVEKGQKLAEIEIAGDPPTLVAVEAPLAGSVLAAGVVAGDSVAAASMGGTVSLFEIADTSKTEVRVEIEERDADRVAPGLAVTLTSPGGRDELGVGVVARLSHRIETRSSGPEDPRVRADAAVRAVWVTWTRPPAEGLVGRHVEAVVRLPESPAVTRLPRRAIVVRDGRTVVDARFLLWSRQVPIAVGVDDGVLAEVSGVTAGTSVFLH